MVWQKMHDDQFTVDLSGTKKVILSIDGGGMRGAIPIAMLAEWEKQSGKKCQDVFHMVGGTSTGTIIAVGLALGMSPQKLLDEVYLTKLPAAFQAQNPGVFARLAGSVVGWILKEDPDFVARLISNGLHYTYPLEPFLTSLQSLSQHQCVSDLKYPKNPILFATTKDILSGETNFVVSEGPGKDRFAQWPLAGVVAASGAAPIFFPPALNRYVDGGVGVYANPCLSTSIQAMEYISREIPDFHDGNVIHVSLGTGYVEDKLKKGEADEYTFLNWLRYVALEGLDDAALQQVFSTVAIYGKTGRMDFRRYNPLLRDDILVQELEIKLNGTPSATLSLNSFKPDQVDLMVEIGREYAKRIDWSKSNLLPWDTCGGQRDPQKLIADDVSGVWDNTPYAA